jgi:histidine triad (HIT) family protein
VDGCLFCRIVGGSIPATVIAEEERAIAFMDIAPAVPGHALVVPRRHADSALEADERDLGAVMALAGRVGRAAESALGATGVTLLSSVRPDGWQTVFHLHVHVLPRRRGDGLVIPWPGDEAATAAIADAAERLRGALGD